MIEFEVITPRLEDEEITLFAAFYGDSPRTIDAERAAENSLCIRPDIRTIVPKRRASALNL